MPTIDQLKPEHLRKREVFEKIKELADSFILHVDEKQAYFFQEKLSSLLGASNLENQNPELYKKYQNLIIKLKWAALPLLSDEISLKVLQQGYLTSFDYEDIDTQNRIEAKMFTKNLFPRNEIRQKMQRALKENKERLGNKTFGEWLIDYSKTFDFRDRDELAPTQYVRQNPEAQTLSEPEKNKLKKALQIFDKTLLATPVISEPLLSTVVSEMIKTGTIKRENIDPTLLQSLSISIKKPEVTRILAKAAAKRAEEAKEEAKREKEPEEKPKKPKKPGFFKRLFGKKKKKRKEKEKKEPELILPTPVIREETPEEISPAYKEKISPYEKERKVTEEIPTFPKKVEEEVKKKEKPAERPSAIQAGPPQSKSLGEESYQIRTMKQDIEKAKKQPIPPKPEPKIKDNIVDLSGK